jgi:hypothetical protein
MKNEKKGNLLDEHLRKIKYRVGYKINESPKYRPLVNDGEEFDKIPLTNEAGEQEDAEKAGGGEQPPVPSNDQPQNTDAPVPAFDKTGGDPLAGGGAPADPNTPPDPNAPVNPMGDDMNAPIEPQQQVDDIQNEIIKHNIAAMQSIHDKLENLENLEQRLNQKLDALNADVEEVREPTNTEKLMSKKNVSYPYYFNLNDFWSGNWFSEQREKEHEKGIKELPDGTYVADFDDLPQKSKADIQNSFNDIT